MERVESSLGSHSSHSSPSRPSALAHLFTRTHAYVHVTVRPSSGTCLGRITTRRHRRLPRCR